VALPRPKNHDQRHRQKSPLQGDLVDMFHLLVVLKVEQIDGESARAQAAALVNAMRARPLVPLEAAMHPLLPEAVLVVETSTSAASATEAATLYALSLLLLLVDAPAMYLPIYVVELQETRAPPIAVMAAHVLLPLLLPLLRVMASTDLVRLGEQRTRRSSSK
jgi:hypothetical protein